MRSLVLLGGIIITVISAVVLAQTVPCDTVLSPECTTAPMCQPDGTCHGQFINEGGPCTQSTSGDCMTAPFVCQHGECVGTTAAADNTPCFIPGLEKCYSAGHCMSVPIANISFCLPGTPKQCQQPSDPCKIAVCNPQTGDCIDGDKCFTFSGCETCTAGTCTPVNLGGACTNPEGDFNPCTTNDVCTILPASSVFRFDPSLRAQMPLGIAAAFDNAQAGERAFCMGEPGIGPTPTPTTAPLPTPTGGAGACPGDCNLNGEVTVNELIVMVNIALGSANVSACSPGDTDGSGDITVPEIVSGVNHLLNGCA